MVADGRKAASNGTATVREPTPETVYMFSYTSGTTGDPKGVKLTHKMMVQCAIALNIRLSVGMEPLGSNDTYISYLPASHSFEQACSALSIVFRMRTGFFAGDVQKLTEDMQLLQPTFFPSVPRLFNRIYGKIQDNIKAATGAKGWLVQQAIASKSYYHKNAQGFTHTVWDGLVFNKIKNMLGGSVRLMITGSAPINPDVLDFLKIAFCCEIMEGYGMTETSAGSFSTLYGDPNSGVVGGPFANVKVRLRDIPEMGHLHTLDPPRGEICMWGTSIMTGYFKNPEKTAEALTSDGWLYSGDVGIVYPNGSVKIIDRAKNIFKLSQGEYIAPEKLENVYVQSSYIL